MAAESEHVSIVINRPAQAVYDYAANPANLPHWAAGLAQSTIDLVDGRWTADSPMGSVGIEFVARNDFGILDHTVTLPTGGTVYNPLRAIPCGAATEVVFTLRRRPGMTDEQFHADADAVRTDLVRLKRVLEA